MTFRNRTDHSGWRMAILLLALLQFAGPVVLQAMDLALEAQEMSSEAHVETEGSEACATHHEVMCQTVRTLSMVARPSLEGRTLSAPLLVEGVHLLEAELPAQGTLVLGSRGSRAPPLA